MLQCSDPTCGKWRRVDASTYEVCGNEHWWFDRITKEKKALHIACPSIIYSCNSWLESGRQRAGDASPVTRAVDLQDFDSFVESLEAQSGPLRDSYSLALLQCFLDVAESSSTKFLREPLTVSPELYDRKEEALNGAQRTVHLLHHARRHHLRGCL